MLRDSQEDEEEEEEGNSCKPHIMRPSVRPSLSLSVRTPEPLRFLRADVITLVRGRTEEKGRRAREREREEGK